VSDDATNWATVKIHEQVRDAASDDSRTYTEIMQAGLDSDTNDGRIGDLEPFGGEVPDFDTSVDTYELAREVAAKIDYAQLAGQVANELEGRMR